MIRYFKKTISNITAVDVKKIEFESMEDADRFYSKYA